MKINIIIPVLNEEKSLKNKIRQDISYAETTEMKRSLFYHYHRQWVD